MCFASVSVHWNVPTAVRSQARAMTIMSIMYVPVTGIIESVLTSKMAPVSAPAHMVPHAPVPGL